eukprot:UN1866
MDHHVTLVERTLRNLPLEQHGHEPSETGSRFQQVVDRASAHEADADNMSRLCQRDVAEDKCGENAATAERLEAMEMALEEVARRQEVMMHRFRRLETAARESGTRRVHSF